MYQSTCNHEVVSYISIQHIVDTLISRECSNYLIVDRFRVLIATIHREPKDLTAIVLDTTTELYLVHHHLWLRIERKDLLDVALINLDHLTCASLLTTPVRMNGNMSHISVIIFLFKS